MYLLKIFYFKWKILVNVPCRSYKLSVTSEKTLMQKKNWHIFQHTFSEIILYKNDSVFSHAEGIVPRLQRTGTLILYTCVKMSSSYTSL